MKASPQVIFLRILLIWLGLQKAVDALLSLLLPSAAYTVLRVLGVGGITSHDPLHQLLPQLWGGASLAWAYFLLRAGMDPQRNGIIVEGSAVGFVALGLVAVMTPMPMVRVIGVLFFVEAVLLLIGRSLVDQERPAFR